MPPQDNCSGTGGDLGDQWIQKKITPQWQDPRLEGELSTGMGTCLQVTVGLPGTHLWHVHFPLQAGTDLEMEKPWERGWGGRVGDGHLLDPRNLAGLGPGTRLKESRADGAWQAQLSVC